jgi:hypothetical protein
MTYNFDPDTWLTTNRAALEARRDRGEFSDEELKAELEDLDRRYEEMVARLDGTYEIPSGGSGDDRKSS